MNKKEIGEIRRRQRPDRSTMTKIYGCYIIGKEIHAEFERSIGTMPANDADKYFGMLRRVMGGEMGKRLIDITFRTSQVADSPEHKMLMDLRGDKIADEENRSAFFHKVADAIGEEGSSHLIILGTETYDVPFKSKDDETQADNSTEQFTYTLCAICPVKETKAGLHYEPTSKDFQDGKIAQAAATPVLGFMFPAFDNRATNIYNALYYTRDTKNQQEALIQAIFNTHPPLSAKAQKETFNDVLMTSLEEECSLALVQGVHGDIRDRIALHKESKCKDLLTVTETDLTAILASKGVSEEKQERFREVFAETFGHGAEVIPDNLIEKYMKIQVNEDIVLKVSADQADRIEARIIGGGKYIVIPVDDDANVNGINIKIN